MEVIVLDSAAFEQLKKEIQHLVKQGIKEVVADLKLAESEDFIPLKEAQKILPYKSKTTWQEFRDKGIIEFTQMGRKILYSKKSIIAYIIKNKVKF